MSNNEMVSVPRELAHRLLNAAEWQKLDFDRSDSPFKAEIADTVSELSALLVAQHVVCSNGILCQNSKCVECGGNGSYKPAAQPVPPAGGEPLIHINPAVLSMLRGGLKAAPGGITFSLSEPVGGWTVPLYEQHVVSRLQAEVETLRAALRTEVEAGDSWKREAHGLREELDALKATPQGDVRPIAYMRNEGTPNNLVKCTFTCPGAFGVYRHPPQPQGEPVAVVLPGRRPFPCSIRDTGWNACLDELKRLNQWL